MTAQHDEWEQVDVPRGAYISWGEQPGQRATGRLIDYEADGGTDFAGKVCPLITMELTEPTFSVNKAGQRSEHGAGEQVMLNAGLVSLKRAVKAAGLAERTGWEISIVFSNLVRTANGTVKEFDIHRRPPRAGAAPAPQSAPPASWGGPPASAPAYSPAPTSSAPPF